MPELQQPDIVGNFLSSYYTAQQKQQADADRQRNMMRQDRADSMAQQQFDWQSQDRALEAAAEATSKELRLLKPGDKAGFDAALQRLVAQGHIKPEDAGKYNYTMLPDLLMQDKQWREAKAFQTQQQLTQAQIAAANRSNRPQAGGGGQGNAPSGYQWVRGADGNVSLAPITGGPADPNKIAAGEGTKVRTANAQLDMLEKSLENYAADLNRTSTAGRLFTRGAEVSRVESGHTDLLMQMKNMYELGVLNGPDYMLMTKIVEDPTSLMSSYRGTDGLAAQLDTVKSIIKRARTINATRLGGGQPVAGAETPPPPPAGGAGASAATTPPPPPPPPPGFRISQ